MGLDPEDQDLLAHHWYPSVYGYLVRQTGKSGTPQHRTIYLHRVVAERMFDAVPPDQVVDHRNGDRQDNRRSNLRLVNRSQHAINRATVNKTGFRWVHATGRTFRADVKSHGFRVRRGGFKTAAEAHAWAVEQANAMHGEDSLHHLRGETDRT